MLVRGTLAVLPRFVGGPDGLTYLAMRESAWRRACARISDVVRGWGRRRRGMDLPFAADAGSESAGAAETSSVAESANATQRAAGREAEGSMT